MPANQQKSHPNPPPIILIVDDHDHVRASLRAWLGAAFPACEFIEAESGERAVILAREHRPRLALMDIGLPGISGLEAARAILKERPETKVVMLSIHDETRYRENAAEIGVTNFVSKSNMRVELIPAIVKALAGESEERIFS